VADVRGWAARVVATMSDQEIVDVVANGVETWLEARNQLPPGLDADDRRALVEEVEALIEDRTESLESLE